MPDGDLPGGAGSSSERGRPASPPAGGEAGAGADEIAALVLRQLREIGAQLGRLADVRLERARVGLRTGAFRLALAGWAALAVAAVTIAGGWRLVGGLSDALAALSGGVGWVGDLAAGALAIGGTALVLWLVRARSRRSNVKRMLAKYGGRSVATPEPAGWGSRDRKRAAG